jgi:sulfotransferase family protein
VTKLVYIGGYGHSGSTLLEYLLAASPEVIACGEVASVLRERGRKDKCTCRRDIKDCPVWGPLFASPATLEDMSHAELVLTLVARDGGAHDVLVDSSKTAWRSIAVPFRLARELGSDFKLVHLVRDPRAVSWSAVKKAKRRGARPLLAMRCASAAAGWWIANLACELFGQSYPDRYLRLRYEDLARSPSDAMRDLFAKLLPESEWRADEIGGSDTRHQLYGNRMRAASLSLAEVKEDAGWQHDMPDVVRALVALLTAPLRWRYGYN